MNQKQNKLEISIVSTMFRSRPFLEEFLDGCIRALETIGCTDFEIIMVNDGSPDDSLDYILERKKTFPQLVIVDLSRNFGHHNFFLHCLRTACAEKDRKKLIFHYICAILLQLSKCKFLLFKWLKKIG